MHWTKHSAAYGALLGGLAFSCTTGLAQEAFVDTVTPAEFLSWEEEFKNWGRWGPDDQLGMTNLITPEKIKEAAALVQDGTVISLAHPVPMIAAADVRKDGLFNRSTNRIGPT